MPAQFPSDDSQLPQLRRFRFDPQNANVPREVTSDRVDARPADTSSDADDSGDADVSDRLEDRDDYAHDDLVGDPDELLASIDDRSAPAAVTPPTSVRRAAAPAPRTGPVSAPISAPVSGPVSTPAPIDQPASRSQMPLILACVAGIVVLALIGWFVFKPADKPTASDSTKSSAVSTAEWADDACAALSSFENAAMPIRAAAVKEAAEPGQVAATVTNLRREASTILGDLSARLDKLGTAENDSAIAPVQTSLRAAVAAAVTATGGSPNGSVGGPGAAAAAISQALSAPLTAFKDAVSKLDEATRTEAIKAKNCASLL